MHGRCRPGRHGYRCSGRHGFRGGMRTDTQRHQGDACDGAQGGACRQPAPIRNYPSPPRQHVCPQPRQEPGTDDPAQVGDGHRTQPIQRPRGRQQPAFRRRPPCTRGQIARTRRANAPTAQVPVAEQPGRGRGAVPTRRRLSSAPAPSDTRGLIPDGGRALPWGCGIGHAWRLPVQQDPDDLRGPPSPRQRCPRNHQRRHARDSRRARQSKS